MRLSFLLRTLWLLTAAAPFATLSFANVVVNGDFEAGAASGIASPSQVGVYVFGGSGHLDIGGWTVSPSGNNNGSANPLSVLITANPPQPPAGGAYALDFDPFWDVTTGALLSGPVVGTLPQISQVINLAAGDYTLSFDAAVEDVPAGTRSLAVMLTGSSLLNAVATTSQNDTIGYQHFSYAFSSTGGNTTLSFTPNDYSPEPNFMLDNVSIEAAPEPSFLGLLAGASLLGMAAMRKRPIHG